MSIRRGCHLFVLLVALGVAAASHGRSDSLTAPSTSLKPHQGAGYSLSIPANWQADRHLSGTTYFAAPDGKRTKKAGKDTIVTILLGMAIGQEKSTAATVGTAADQQVRELTAINPGLRVTSRQATTLDGVAAESLLFESRSTRDGALERNWMLLALRDGRLFYVVLTSPARDYDRLRGMFAQIVGSIRFGAPAPVNAAAPAPGAPRFVRHASTNPAFVLYRPETWRVAAESANGALRVTVSDPDGSSAAQSVFAGNPQGRYNSATLLAAQAGELKSRHPDLTLGEVQVCRDAAISCAAATFAYSVQGTPVKGRLYVHAEPKFVAIRSYHAPAARLQALRPVLLDVLTNLRVSSGGGAAPVRLVSRRATDGSLSLDLPADWTLLAQKGTALASAAAGNAGFVFTVFQVMPSNYGVAPPPGVIVAGYEPPASVAPRIFAQFGNRNIRVLGASPDPATAADCPRRIGRACDAADVQLSWISPQGAACTGSFKLLNARPGVTGQWFTIIAGLWGPSNDLGRLLPTLEQVGASFRINDAYAAGYIRSGLAHLKAMQRDTANAMQGLYDAIHANQADYERRTARKDAVDARGDDYRRGNSYWISDLEGGKVYATDPWGTRDTRTGARYDGAGTDYIHFDGQNPVHASEQMREVSSYELQQLGYRH